jgi:glycosyltransferase involved in cell wall biosynthesis
VVSFVVPGPLSTRTGGYEYDRRLLEHLRERGVESEVVELGGDYPWPDARARAQAAAAFAALATGAVVVVDGLALGTLPAEVGPHADRLRLVALVHHPLALEAGLSEAQRRQLFESERAALGLVRAVVVTSDATTEALAPYGLVRDPVVAVPGTPRMPLARGSGTGQVRVLTVASIVPRKGYAVMVEALARIEALPWTLRCVGGRRDKPTAASIEQLVTKLGLDARIAFLGELDAVPLSEEYQRADLFVLPSLYEGYGMAVAEAVAHGLPVVATATGGIPGLLQGGAGLVCRPGDVDGLTDALRLAIGDAPLRQRLATASRHSRDTLPTWDHAASIMEHVLHAVEAA